MSSSIAATQEDFAGLVLALNSGSSSLKFAVFRSGKGDEELILSGSADGIGHADGTLNLRTADGRVLLQEDHKLESQTEALAKLSGALGDHLQQPLIAVGHRVVHGGPKLRTHQLVTTEVLTELKEATHYAPLHIPLALTIIDQAQQLFPQCPQFACFDTSFHRNLPPVAQHLPLPARYFDQGVFRYGFHGLSYESIVHRLGAELPERAVFAHLGNGSSLAAVRGGVSIDTTMGFTPTGGIPMSTRTGDLDPGALLYIMRTENLGAAELEQIVNRTSGLLALSNGESDMKKLQQRSGAGDALAQLAVDAFVIGVRKTIGAYAALMGGLDLLVFSGGIGGHSDEVRRLVCGELGFLGLSLASGANPKVKVLPAEEERQIARHCRRLLMESSEISQRPDMH
jgi:acetate kinase